jgi:hypothetical protein
MQLLNPPHASVASGVTSMCPPAMMAASCQATVTRATATDVLSTTRQDADLACNNKHMEHFDAPPPSLGTWARPGTCTGEAATCSLQEKRCAVRTLSSTANRPSNPPAAGQRGVHAGGRQTPAGPPPHTARRSWRAARPQPRPTNERRQPRAHHWRQRAEPLRAACNCWMPWDQAAQQARCPGHACTMEVRDGRQCACSARSCAPGVPPC